MTREQREGTRATGEEERAGWEGTKQVGSGKDREQGTQLS